MTGLNGSSPEATSSFRSALVHLLEDLHRRNRDLLDFRSATIHLLNDLTERSRELVRTRQVLIRLLEESEANRAELERKNEKLGRAAESRANMLSVLSHEVRTPIGVILGYIEMAAEELETADATEIRGWLRRAREAGLGLLQLCNGVLDFRRLEEGVVTLKPTRVDLARLAEELRVEMEMFINGRSIAFRVACAAGAIVWTDAVRLRQILVNLLSNAAKFTESGEVTLRIREVSPDVVIEVADTGPGIPPQRQSDLFAPFGVTTPRGGGSGLGLAIAKRLTDLLGGCLELETQEGRGTVFRLRLSVEQESTDSLDPIDYSRVG